MFLSQRPNYDPSSPAAWGGATSECCTSLYCLPDMTRSLLHIEEAPDTKTSPQIDCSAMFHVSRQLVQTNVAILKVIQGSEYIFIHMLYWGSVTRWIWSR